MMRLRGLSRAEAEALLVDHLNAIHPDTDPNCCAHCGKPETPGSTLLPIGGPRHTWLHSHCWEPWRAQRRAKAEEDLALGTAP
jgi:hypothetical protein